MMNKISTLYTVDGSIQELRVVPGVLNLIQDIQKGTLFTGVAVGMAGHAGMLANAVSLALYEGEDVEHVALLINGRLAIGTFEWLQDLSVGDEVKLVVSDIEAGALFIHAILRNSDQLLWTPYSVSHTRFGWVMHAMKLSAVMLILIWAMFGAFFLFSPNLTANSQELTWLILFSIALMGFVAFMSTRGVMDLGARAEAIFEALGIPKFKRFKIKPYSILNLHFIEDPHSLKKKFIFKFADALAAHKKKFKLPLTSEG